MTGQPSAVVLKNRRNPLPFFNIVTRPYALSNHFDSKWFSQERCKCNQVMKILRWRSSK